MSDEEVILAAIIAYPGEDTPRLAYADWLDEHGESDRAEFIRVQIERTRLLDNDPTRRALFGREAQLLVASKNGWLRPYLSLTGWNGLFIRRGIVEIVVTTFDRLVPQMQVLRALTALIELRLWCQVNDPPDSLTPPASGSPDLFADSYSEVCLAPCSPGLRIRYFLSTTDRNPRGEVSQGIDLLAPAPNELEPALTADEWLILSWAANDVAQRQRVGTLILSLIDRVQNNRDQSPRWRLGVRPYHSTQEFPRWCRLKPLGPGPHWIRLSAGQLLDHRSGLEPPHHWLNDSSSV